MLARLQMFWVRIRDSLWFIPAVLTLLAFALSLVLVKVDAAYDINLFEDGHWLMGGSVDGARAVLSTIAGSIITITGVVFSITIVALQLASSQFTPRVLRNFLADRSNQTVLGVFIGTFTYTLLVLRVVRSTSENDSYVPEVSVAVAILMALISIGFLIHFIHHAASSIQAGVILHRITSEALEKIQKLFPEQLGKPESTEDIPVEVPSEQSVVVKALHEGYLQAVDGKTLFELGERQRLLIRMIPPIGEFVVEGMPLAEVWSDDPLGNDTLTSIRGAFIVGSQRSPEQDVEFYLLEIADIAVKALSPSVNDPTTAIHCVDRLMQILLALGKREAPSPLRTKEGRVHFIAKPCTFERAARVSFDQILHFGRDNPAIVDKLSSVLRTLQELVPAKRHEPLIKLRAALPCVRN